MVIVGSSYMVVFDLEWLRGFGIYFFRVVWILGRASGFFFLIRFVLVVRCVED